MIMDYLWCIEHSQYQEDWGRDPFHTGPLLAALQDNLEDCIYNLRENNKYQLVYIGTQRACATKLEELREYILDKHKQNPQKPTGTLRSD